MFVYYYCLVTVFIIDFLQFFLLIFCVKFEEIVKKAHHNFLEPTLMSSNWLFCPANSPEPKDNQFTIT